MNESDLVEAPGIFGKKRFPIAGRELKQAILDNDVAKLCKLIGWGAHISNRCGGDNALHLAVYHNKLECAELLIMFGADLNDRNINGRTALMIAAYNGNVEMLKLLLRNKADVRLINTDPVHSSFEMSAIDYATNTRNYADCLTLLLDAQQQQIEFEIAEEELKKSSKGSAPELKK